ncbi:hypothetical protein GWA11_23605 [Vibrio parahaemolyticus]|nr:hypothetical protein [Vibrio parahaemolyticus]
MDIQVQNVLDKIEEKVRDLDSLQEPLINESIVFTKETTESFMQLAIRNNPDRVQALGADGLKPIKSDFQAIVESLDTLGREVLEDDSIWVYRRAIDLNNIAELESRSFFVSGRRLPTEYEEKLRVLLSPIGEFLSKNELADADSWKRQGGQFRYSYGLSITDRLMETAKIFGKKHSEYESLIRELKDANRKSQQNSALDLWDSI